MSCELYELVSLPHITALAPLAVLLTSLRLRSNSSTGSSNGQHSPLLVAAFPEYSAAIERCFKLVLQQCNYSVQYAIQEETPHITGVWVAGLYTNILDARFL